MSVCSTHLVILHNIHQNLIHSSFRDVRQLFSNFLHMPIRIQNLAQLSILSHPKLMNVCGHPCHSHMYGMWILDIIYVQFLCTWTFHYNLQPTGDKFKWWMSLLITCQVFTYHFQCLLCQDWASQKGGSSSGGSKKRSTVVDLNSFSRNRRL